MENIRKGMWVTVGSSVGIVTDISSDIEVTHVKQDGTTLLELDNNNHVIPVVTVCLPSQVTKAKISEIPKSRYESKEQLVSLGYGE